MWMKATCGLCGLAMAFAALGQAEPDPAFLHATNPNGLATWVVVSDKCSGLSMAEAEEAVKGVLVRSRIKPLDTPKDGERLALWVSIDCLDAHTAFNVQVDFVRGANGSIVRGGLVGYGIFGTYAGDKNFLLASVKQSTEKAVTDYLKANFDLGK
jgi:hypothetical protein